MHFPSHPELKLSDLRPTIASVDRGFALSTPGQLKRLFNARRKLLVVPLDFGSEINADYFLWSQSAPVSDALTKRGGLPFVEKGFSWPSTDGNPLTFLGQVCLCDSVDIIDIDLRFDTLSIFSDSPMPTNEPGSIVIHAASRKTGSTFPLDSVPENVIVLPELIGTRVRFPVFPEFHHQNIFIDGYVDYELLFPHGTYICNCIRSIQPSVANLSLSNGVNGLVAWSGMDWEQDIQGVAESEDRVDQYYQTDDSASSWMQMAAGAILIGIKNHQLIAEYQIC